MTEGRRLRLLEKVVDPPTVDTWSPVPEKDIERRIANLERAVFGEVDPGPPVRRRHKCDFCGRWVIYRYVQTDTHDSLGLGPHLCRGCVRNWKEELGDKAGDWEVWDAGETIGGIV